MKKISYDHLTLEDQERRGKPKKYLEAAMAFFRYFRQDHRRDWLYATTHESSDIGDA